MTDRVTCPSCGAANPGGSEWCGQCFYGFGSASAPARTADDQIEQPAHPQPAPARPIAPPPAPKGQIRPPVPPGRLERPAPAFPAPPSEPAATVGAGWTCASCGTENAVTSDICRSCDTSIYRTFGAEDEVRPAVEPATAALWGLLPGGGHFKLKEAGLGLAVAGLILSALAFGVLMVSGNRRPLGFVLLLLGGVAWAISIYDATRFAADNDDAVLLRPRVITAVMGIVFAIVIVAAVSITGEEPIP